MLGIALDPTVSTLLWVIFAAASALALTLGLILTYHWIRFSMSFFTPFLALGAYAAGALIFLSAMSVALVLL